MGDAIQKYLNNNERILHQLTSTVNVDHDDGFGAYLTNFRLIFLKTYGWIFKKDRFIDIHLKELSGAKMMEEGLFFKKRHLELRMGNQTIRISGDHKDILEFHKKINNQLMGRVP